MVDGVWSVGFEVPWWQVTWGKSIETKATVETREDKDVGYSTTRTDFYRLILYFKINNTCQHQHQLTTQADLPSTLLIVFSMITFVLFTSENLLSNLRSTSSV